MFYAPWCGYCTKFRPQFSRAAAELVKSHSATCLAAVDCTVDRPLCGEFGVSGYPDVRYFVGGKEKYRYDGDYTSAAVLEWLKAPVPAAPLPPPPVATPFLAESDAVPDELRDAVTLLSGSDFQTFLLTHESVFVFFYAPWCAHCRSLKVPFVSLAAGENVHGTSLAAVDSTVDRRLARQNGVYSYPVLILFK